MEGQQKLERRARRLRERIDALDRGHATAPYPEQIRRKVAQFAERARSAQPAWAWKKISEKLGVAHASVRKWHRRGADEASTGEVDEMVPVQVGGLEGRGVDASASPSGISVEVGEASIEGLTLEEAVEAARRLK